MTPDRKTLLEWFETLSTRSLRRLWNEHTRRLNVSKYRYRRHKLENRVALFRMQYATREPIAWEWRILARRLQNEGLYSKKTAVMDIVHRLKKL